MEDTQDFLHQQERNFSISLRPVEIATLLAILLEVGRYGGPKLVQACAYLRGLIQGDCDVEVHVEALNACVDELLKDMQEG
ncbi:hypothetical protein P3W85_02460 [Cupriavidus basilensis]|uniref:Uncharacterized protein n=1 Tax=Cupriavidus basilensis TaxID=68895 RepID=A0ABT6AHF2_9BURK|nr:hypothetical protein [Cupriavidus basilensis]MDF3831823.1 hypothetical protein [Cupriavidus basilensis]